MADLPVTEGKVTFNAPGLDKECKTYYKIVGKFPLQNGNPLLVVLHGGPGAGHDYLLGLSDVASKYSTTVIFYDQIGNGRSTHLPETAGDEAFWREPLFIRELENLLDHLGLHETGFHLFGQSWGGMFESPAYQEAVGVFYKKHLCRVEPWPAPEVSAALKWLTDDTNVYGTMNGPSKLTLTGSLTGWTVIDRLKNISIPTLMYDGDLDEAQDLCVQPFFEHIPKVRWVTLPNSSDFTHADHKDKVIRLIGEFLTSSPKSS